MRPSPPEETAFDPQWLYSGTRGSSVPVAVLATIPGGRFKVQNLADAAQRPFTLKADLLRGDGEPMDRWQEQSKKATEEPAKPAPAPQTTRDVPPRSKKSAKVEQPGKVTGMSGLDAAAAVLAKAGGPLNTKELLDRMLAAGLWKTGGKTPSATLYTVVTMLPNMAA